MRKQQRNTSTNPAAILLKTCQTCFNAKIRCDQTQDSGSCDRCVRLDKPCIFSPARRQNPPRSKRLVGQRQSKLDQIIASSHAPSQTRVRQGDVRPTLGTDTGTTVLLAPQALVSDDSHDPLAIGWLDETRAVQLFQVFRSQMMPRFPFVVLSEAIDLQDLRRQRPCTYLAMLAVASFSDFPLQRKLSGLFNRLLAARLSKGTLVFVDVLQGLLLHIAW